MLYVYYIIINSYYALRVNTINYVLRLIYIFINN